MALIFYSEDDLDRFESWSRALLDEMPGLDIRSWERPGNVAEIDYALLWKPPHGVLKTFPNLKAIFSVGAGVDALLSDPDLPVGVPLCRMVDASLTRGMVEYTVLHVLRHHRDQPLLAEMQRARKWEAFASPLASERQVGVMGLGEIGGAVASALVDLGFHVAGWSRGARDISGVECHHGPDGLRRFLKESEILICLLPLTARTESILNGDLFAQLPKGACLINAGRGGLQVEADILAALEAGQLGYVTLDVFQEEPLPVDHPFWGHPRVTVTPHNAAITSPRSATKIVAENIRRIEAGETPINVVDRNAGY
ncbi:MAG: glyoxylate/hydroxypyruvate reductase A [Proteobacteria bacterium]|nr:glyoxylate/hydroxypyruvate reductase A [Pseudomonadota bacterium]